MSRESRQAKRYLKRMNKEAKHRRLTPEEMEAAAEEAEALRQANVGAPKIQPTISEDEDETTTGEVNRLRMFDRNFLLILFAVIVLLLLLMLTFGTNVYRSIVASGNADDQLRLQTTLLANSIHIDDAQDCASTDADGPEGAALVLTERLSSGTFETRIYQYDGYICQEYALASADYDPESATKICQSSTFSFTIEGNLITLTTDAGTSRIALRSSQGGE